MEKNEVWMNFINLSWFYSINTVKSEWLMPYLSFEHQQISIYHFSKQNLIVTVLSPAIIVIFTWNNSITIIKDYFSDWNDKGVL